MSDQHERSAPRDYGGRGLPEEYETVGNEISSWKYAILSLLQDAEYKFVGWPDDAPKYESDTLAFVFDHPDEEGGFMIPIRFRDLEVLRAVRRRNGWTSIEDVGVFDELPEWAGHHPPEDGGSDDE